MVLEQNIENIILEKSGWTEKQKEYYGVLIHNMKDSKSMPIADVISKRDNDGVTIEWFIPNKEGEKISLAYVRDSNSLNTSKTDNEIKSQSDVFAFLDNVERTIKDSKPYFFPKSKFKITKKSTLGM